MGIKNFAFVVGEDVFTVFSIDENMEGAELTYLTGGDDWFGPDLGGATVFTNTRAGYSAACPNVGALLNNLVFTLAMENEIMGAILNDGADPVDAATAWMSANPDLVMGWLDGVTTVDGGDARAAMTTALGL